MKAPEGFDLQQAETDLVWAFGSVYPVAIICTVYATNQLGEKKLIEQKQFNLSEGEKKS